jgi:preprotein translocase subunit Sec61beta
MSKLGPTEPDLTVGIGIPVPVIVIALKLVLGPIGVRW